MELIIKSNNEESLRKIIGLAMQLDVVIEKRDDDYNEAHRVNLKNRILNFKPPGSTSYGDAAEWEQRQRSDRELPFS